MTTAHQFEGSQQVVSVQPGADGQVDVVIRAGNTYYRGALQLDFEVLKGHTLIVLADSDKFQKLLERGRRLTLASPPSPTERCELAIIDSIASQLRPRGQRNATPASPTTAWNHFMTQQPDLRDLPPGHSRLYGVLKDFTDAWTRVEALVA